MMSYRTLACLIVALGATPAQAQLERERIAAERAAATARFAEQERACRERFVVTACVDAARKEERLTLARLHRAELVLDEGERREAGARRRQILQERAAAQEARASEPAEPHREKARTAPAPNAPAASHPQRPAASAAEQRASEQRNEAAFEARARSARAHRESVERRNALRASEGKVAAPLPVPSGASAP